MKWEPKERHSKSPRAYQILSQRPEIALQRPNNGIVSPIANNYSNADVACMDQMSLGVHTGTKGQPASWSKVKRAPHQRERGGGPTPDELERQMCPRPLTATLERPRVLNIALLGKIDMTLTRKCMLSISNLCIADAAKRNGGSLTDGRGGKARKFIGGGAAGVVVAACRRRRRQQQQLTASEDEDSRSMTPPAPQTAKRQLKAPAPRRRPNDARGDSEPEKAPAVPQPCTTCGRPEQPERLHSHPPAKNQQGQGQSQPPAQPQPPKSSVRKPVPMNFRSSTSGRQQARSPGPHQPAVSPGPHQAAVKSPGKATATSPQPGKQAKSPGPRQVMRPTQQATSKQSATQQQQPQPQQQPPQPQQPQPQHQQGGAVPRPGRPPTVTCYICGREFGSKSFPLHEPHCLQKWHRENASQPAHLQRAPPKKPDQSIDSEEWNKLAWEAVQATLLPCSKCSRTFNPDRLEVHQRSCKNGGTPRKTAPQAFGDCPPDPAPAADDSLSPGIRVGHACRWCHRLFGSASLAIHEAKCVQRPDTQPEQPPSAPGSAASEGRRGPRILLCYLCGRGFTSASLHIHEASCLKKWHFENDKLPPSLRRPEPVKPVMVLSDSGQLDLDATVAAAWQSHLQQLVPCPLCGRTFNPDRLEVHQRACKGRR